ncbi:TIGR03087 family PEP-CTERM/XrtA system glycosyltransferase [Pseudoduganella umbonata]|uniref:Sugar transferase (PEP-CTERM/EpsH1 system associated) n=1 Tax=Pseudoduganella umbonata TaxID=864828 RepID=A0A4P8HSE3_9BURK|nr:TIGR03087 family PEP-CTERM/XrtA system glycosyltransferase [Pseudoduganella umbonata]MBB3223809.1 sugar transferase (PEP-CTERM/EpsH1 system associated) [Pseudoduganella umbonata]QCP12773.1 TIGR03087 family PEP-CTERM/XrtA system glycosyltransferase [Pseudoduganella umbonata]
MEDLLLLVHRIPYPPNKGDKIRSWHLLRHLAARYRVHLATFVDDPDDWQYVANVRQLCASSHFAPLNPTRARLRSLRALLANRALSLDYYSDRSTRTWVQRTMRDAGIERVVVFSSPMAQYMHDVPGVRRVVDLCDVDSEKWRAYADKKSWPASLLYGYEANRLLRYEREVAANSDAALFVSAPEAALFRTLAPESASRIGWFGNGVDTVYFSPDAVHANPYPSGENALVFCGAMDYWPNVDAVQWFAHEVLPLLRARMPHTSFFIVGARPAPEVQALANLPGVTVTGTVPDVRPYVAHAALSVAPLRVARGIQNKVLEAMSMGKAVVVSPQALEGIDAAAGSEVLLAEHATDVANTIVAALSDGVLRAALGRAARARIEASYGWDARLAPLDALLEAPRQPAGTTHLQAAVPSPTWNQA